MKKIVLIPTYNEIENIEAVVRRVLALPVPVPQREAGEQESGFEVLVIDDGSPDGTARKVRELQREFQEEIQEDSQADIQEESRGAFAGGGGGGRRLHLMERSAKQGLGTAYIAGFRWALERGYAYVFEMDADLSHNPDDLPRLYAACAFPKNGQSGADVAVGSRYVSGANVVNWPLGRIVMSYGASMYARWVLGVRIMDFTAGFVCYRAQVLRDMELDRIRMRGYGFQIEMKYTARKLGFRVVEVPIVFVDRTRGQSKMSGGIFGEAFWGVIRLKFKKLHRR